MPDLWRDAILCVSLALVPGIAAAQGLSPTVMSTTGSSGTAGGVQLDQTIGEPMVITVEAAGVRLNQGFQQSRPVRLQLSVRAFLQGPFNSSSGHMHDSLRTRGQLPLLEPYTALGFTQLGGGAERTSAAVLAVTGDSAIVDWVFLELRDGNDSTQVIATRDALLRRSGDIVDTDGSPAVAIAAPPGHYFICVRHRNHLGVLTLLPVALNDTAAVALDLTDGSTATYGTGAQKAIGAVLVLWAGDVTTDGVVKYTGPANDRDPILSAIGGVVPTNTISGYHRQDVNLDGTTKYTGTGNDRDIILQNIGGVVPTNVRPAQLP